MELKTWLKTQLFPPTTTEDDLLEFFPNLTIAEILQRSGEEAYALNQERSIKPPEPIPEPKPMATITPTTKPEPATNSPIAPFLAYTKTKRNLVYILFGMLLFFILPIEKRYYDSIHEIETSAELAKEQVKAIYQEAGSVYGNDYPLNMPYHRISVEKVFPLRAIMISFLSSLILIIIDPLAFFFKKSNY